MTRALWIPWLRRLSPAELEALQERLSTERSRRYAAQISASLTAEVEQMQARQVEEDLACPTDRRAEAAITEEGR